MPIFWMTSLSRLILLGLSLWLVGCGSRPDTPATPETAVSDAVQDSFTIERLLWLYADWEGVPYRLGGMSKKGIDCSGFTLLVYRDLVAKSLPRTVEEQLEHGAPVATGHQRPGDLIFFKTGWSTRHVGVSLGDHRFVHASTSQGVMISSLNNSYWKQKFWQIRRYG
ncbi:NlpC/P60 family protein [Shewanella sp.]|uniref:NlpC/P60 family protein n=1 Tax=Shewanella sp. TaxID=50422 RepID=UPI0035669E42